MEGTLVSAQRWPDLTPDFVLLSHPSARQANPLRLENLAGLGFLLFSASMAPGLHARYVALLARWKLAASGTHESESVETLLALVGRGRGAALVPSWARTLPGEGVVFRALPEPMAVTMGVAVPCGEGGQRLLAAIG